MSTEFDDYGKLVEAQARIAELEAELAKPRWSEEEIRVGIKRMHSKWGSYVCTANCFWCRDTARDLLEALTATTPKGKP